METGTKSTDLQQRVRQLEEEVEYLKNEKLAILEAMEVAANLSNFQTSLNRIRDPQLILQHTSERLKQILDFKMMSFYLVSEVDSDFFRYYTFPETGGPLIDKEVDALTEDKTFAWALKRNKPVVVSGTAKNSRVILHSMNTPSRTRGIFVGIMENKDQEILDLSLFLFSITIIACSHALESFELYREIKNKNLMLEEHVHQLEESSRRLQENERKYRILFEQSSNAIVLYDPSTRLPVEFNDLAYKSLGYTREGFRGLRLEDYAMTPLEGLKESIRRILETGSDHFESRHKCKDGGMRHSLVSAKSVRIGNKTLLMAIYNDITARKKSEEDRLNLEKQLRQAQKMESLGTLAGGIAHDFNNILGVILGYGELSLVELDRGKEAHGQLLRGNLGSMVRAVKRARDLVHQILTFSRMGEGKRKPVNLRNIVVETVDLLRATLPSTVSVRHQTGDEVDLTLADPTEIHQLVMNLCTNSLHAMRNRKGILDVSVETCLLSGGILAGQVIAFDNPLDGKYIQITVKDTGHGIAPDVLERVFEPYYTTKHSGDGTGLGLAVVHGIVKGYGGNIAIESEVNKGTTVYIWLPVLEAEGEPETDVLGGLPTGTGYILLVDDEPELLHTRRLILEELGYRVEAATSSTSALKTFSRRCRDFDILITDMTMPGLTGTELAMEVLNIQPGFPVILCTGFSEYIDAKKAEGMGISEFLMKPVSKHAIAVAVRRVLDEAAGKSQEKGK